MPKKKAKKKIARKSNKFTIKMVALGEGVIDVKVRPGTNLSAFLKGNLPSKWKLGGVETRVNNEFREDTYILNEGDQVSFVPKVNGGDRT